jgi:hypothetical protein
MQVKLVAAVLACTSCLVALPSLAATTALSGAPARPVTASAARRLSLEVERRVGLAIARTPTADAAGSPAADTAGAPPDPAKVEMVERIIVNLHCYDLLVYAGELSMLENAPLGAYTGDQKEHLRTLWDDAISTRRAVILHKLAVANIGNFTDEQLATLFALSKIRYLQDGMWEGANSAMVADERNLTPEDTILINKPGAAELVGSFLDSFSADTITPELTSATSEAFQAFVAKP